ncbi:hypothetical protein FGO68_gene9836 [Halteria grandinella]|uniref:Uncharacterized protein n=1 Tax=Halteria grandinella TaxID=5974 RepID=A0A8J8P2P9_HALGN|nr:hypothetical protein FGO68_gene9836 [Halteria grandinella]
MEDSGSKQKLSIKGPHIPTAFPDLPALTEEQLKQLIESRITHFHSASNSYDEDEEEESLRDSDDEMQIAQEEDCDDEMNEEVMQFAALVKEITPEEAARQLGERDRLQRELEQERQVKIGFLQQFIQLQEKEMGIDKDKIQSPNEEYFKSLLSSTTHHPSKAYQNLINMDFTELPQSDPEEAPSDNKRSLKQKDKESAAPPRLSKQLQQRRVLGDILTAPVSQQAQVLLNLTHPSILFVDNPYQESQTYKWRDWLPLVYSQKNTVQAYYTANSLQQREMHVQLEINRMRYSVFGDISLLKPDNSRSSYYPQLSHLSDQVSDLQQMVNDLLLLSPDVKLHQSNIKSLQIELMGYRFQGNSVERRIILGCILSLCQQMRISIYYQVQKAVKKVQINNNRKMNLYYFQPETQQEHLALLRSLNLNEKIISKQDEEKIQKRRVSFAETLINMYQVFTEKIAKLVSLGVYQRAFDLEPPSLYPMYGNKKQLDAETCEDVMSLMKGFFFIHVFNDPLIRQLAKQFRMQTDVGKKVQDLQDEWFEFMSSSGRLTEFVSLLMGEGVYQRYTDMDDMCKANNGRCNHEGVGCMEWNKPLWFESISLYLAQIGEFQKSDTPENERKCVLSDEIFGVKATSLMNIFKTFDWRIFKQTLQSYPCQDCCSLRVNTRKCSGDFQECFAGIGIPMSMWGFITTLMTNNEREIVLDHDFFYKDFSISCICKKAKLNIKGTFRVNRLASLVPNNTSSMDQLFEETELEVKEILRNPLPLSNLYQRIIPPQIRSIIRESAALSQQQKLIIPQTLPKVPEPAPAAAPIAPPQPPQQTVQVTATVQQSPPPPPPPTQPVQQEDDPIEAAQQQIRDQKKKRKRNKKKNKKKLPPTQQQCWSAPRVDDDKEINDECESDASLIEEERNEQLSDDSFDETLRIFQDRLTNIKPVIRKLRPNLSQEWLNRVRQRVWIGERRTAAQPVAI